MTKEHKQTKKLILPSNKNISEITTRFVSKSEHHKTQERKKVVCEVKYINCGICFVDQTSRKLSTRVDEHKLATRRYDPIFSHIPAREPRRT